MKIEILELKPHRRIRFRCKYGEAWATCHGDTSNGARLTVGGVFELEKSLWLYGYGPQIVDYGNHVLVDGHLIDVCVDPGDHRYGIGVFWLGEESFNITLHAETTALLMTGPLPGDIRLKSDDLELWGVGW